MAINSLSTYVLEKLLVLQKKKDALMEQVADIESQIAKAFSGEETSTPAVAPARRRGRKPGVKKVAPAKTVESKPATAKSSRVSAKRQRRGATGEKIVAALEAAGSKGASIAELADATGMRSQNLHVWFNTTGKRRDNIKKIGRARYKIS